MMKRILLLIVLLFCIALTYGQSSWKKVDSKNYHVKSKKVRLTDLPSQYTSYTLDFKAFKAELPKKNSSNSTIKLPNIKGKLSSFYIKEASNFTNPIAKEYGFIKSFNLKGIDDKTATGKITVGSNGVYVTVYSGKHTTFYIDPSKQSKTTFIAYERKHLKSEDKKINCLVPHKKSFGKNLINTILRRGANDSRLRTYRLALACTGEYSQFHLNQQGISSNASNAIKKAAVLSAMNTTISRVNGIYERDLAINMKIVLDTNGDNPLIFLDSSTDNLTNNSASSLLTESQSVCDNIIGNSNYDIGHTFSTAAGGLAALGVVCKAGSKARGVTGTRNPINDPYDIDYVAHEIGHQFGATHTFNNSCEGNRSNSSAVEPGSGSSIMGYGGICAPNVQNKSDDYFHAVSIETIWNTIQSTSCNTALNTNNTAPTAIAGQDVSVPKSTPLVLRGQASDPEGNSLTYSWEQIDAEIATMPPSSTNTGGPLFRSFPPTESPNRYLPKLSTVISGNTSTTWEVLPSVAREINFSFLVRDNNSGGGSSARDDIKISVIDTAPFTVNDLTNNTWSVGSLQTITWNASTTNQAPINCTNVRIKLSTDGGVTFPITLVESTPNDGSHELSIPNHVTDTARIMIEAIDNIFYNVNSNNFTIISSEPTFLVKNNTEIQSVCNNTNNNAVYNLNLEFLNGFNETVRFNATNLPAGASAVFSPATINTNGTITMTVSGLSGSNQQEYNITVTGNSTSINQTTNVKLIVIGTNFSQLALTTPQNGSSDVSVIPTLQWSNNSNASSYDVMVASDANFNNIIVNENTTTNSYSLESPLTTNTTYFWKVKPKNSCGEGTFSGSSSFTTQPPSYCSSTFTQSNNSEYISNVTFNTIKNNSGNDHSSDNEDGYQDFTSLSTTIKRTLPYEISVSFDVAGYQDHCYVFIDWNQDYIFDPENERYDLGELYNPPNTPPAPGPLTKQITVPENAALGETRMRVIIEYFDSDAPNGEGSCDSDHESEWGETEDYTLVIEEKPDPDFTITNSSGDLSVCKNSTNEQTFVLDYNTLYGFTENVEFSISGLPTNVTSTFSPSKINSNGNVNLTLSNLNTAIKGDYNLTIKASSTSLTKETNILININDGLCNSKGNTTSQISTTLVKFGSINNSSTKTNGYSDYRNISTSVVRGETYNLETNSNTNGNQIQTFAWVDWNQNCLFENTETYNLTTASGKLDITVPENAKLGSTTLRIISKLASDKTPVPCRLDFDGETEDYTIRIEESFATSENLFNDLKVYPVPSDGKINVNFRVKSKDLTIVRLYDLRGRLIFSQKFSTISSLFAKEIDFGNLSSELYLLQIENDGILTTRKIIIK